MSKIIDLTKVVDQSWALESGIQFKESGIPLTIRIQNPSSTEKKNPESVCLGLPCMGRHQLNYLWWRSC